MTPNQSRRHHSPRSNKWCVDNELLACVLQMIVSPTLNSLSQDLDLVERRFEWKATWGRLKIKIHMVGMEYHDLNTSVGGSLSENVYWKCRYFLMALSPNEEWVEGYIYSLHTESNRYTQFAKLGGTEWLNSVEPIQQT